MGRNLALNWRDNGVRVSGFDTDSSARERFAATGAGLSFDNIDSLVDSMELPRVICLLIPAGLAVENQIRALLPLLSPGDIIVDAGNSHFRATEAWQAASSNFGVSFVGMGVSGGETGARYGAALMAGGDAKTLNLIEHLFVPIAARSQDGKPCFRVVGPGGAGHFVKIMHNGIEYAVMQLIAEAVYLMRRLGKMTPREVSRVLHDWQNGELASYLMEVSAEVIAATDPDDGGPLVDKIVDSAGQKGTGHWAVEAALELGIPAPSISEAVFARYLSGCRLERREHMLSAPRAGCVEPEQLLPALHDALVGGMIAAYAQGFAVITAASRTYHWSIDMTALASGWTNGCIIRANILQEIVRCFRKQPYLSNLILDPNLARRLDEVSSGWRQTAIWSANYALPAPLICTGLAWRDSFAAGRLWADLIQGQRDRFGAHGFERVDRPGHYNHNWNRQ